MMSVRISDIIGNSDDRELGGDRFLCWTRRLLPYWRTVRGGVRGPGRALATMRDTTTWICADWLARSRSAWVADRVLRPGLGVDGRWGMMDNDDNRGRLSVSQGMVSKEMRRDDGSGTIGVAQWRGSLSGCV